VSSTLCDSAWISSLVSNRRPFSFNFMFGNRRKSQGAKSGEYGGWGMTAILQFARICWVRTEVWDWALSWWSRQVCSRQSSVRRLRTFSLSLLKTSQQNSEFTVWPVGTGASHYHNCCIGGGTSPEYVGYYLVRYFCSWVWHHMARTKLDWIRIWGTLLSKISYIMS
jgi:hypothetical protein